jgi:4-amino-4-deoxy-L-arabinose transferase-like glycosyltransferase
MPAASAETPPTWRFPLVVAVVLAARLVVAANLHLTEDEAYYRLWSMAPAFGYYDHPPMTAWWIAAGRAMVGDNALGVRLLPCLGSAATSLLVFDMARLAGGDRRTAERAGVWFNATLLVACGGFLAVPDAPAALFWGLTLWSLLRAIRSGSLVWWLAAGVAAGLATLSKYSALFLGPGILLWLVTSADGRRRLLSPGPWLALIVAGGLFGVNVAWNATHHWLTFAKQFGRIAPHGFSPRYLPELVLTQALLLNPVLVVFLARWRPSRATPAARLFLLSSAPFAAYLMLHSLHDRVQAHWPAPIYPAAAILAAFAAARLQAPAWRWARLGVPATAIVAVLGLAALAALPPATFARSPDLFLPLRGWRAFADSLDATRRATGGAWIGTTSYGLASELADEPLRAPVIQIAERERWRGPTTGPAPRLDQPGLVVDLTRRLDPTRLRTCFADVRFLGDTPRGAAGEKPKLYGVYRVAGPRRDVIRDGCW